MERAPFAFLAALLALPVRILGQGDVTADRTAIAESIEVRRNAERAARTFEQRRLRLLPNVPSSRSPGPGDIVIGRYWYGASEADKIEPPPEEPAAIADARRSLLHTLDSASRTLPRDDWIRARLVWYSIEAGDTAAAKAAARGCRDDDVPWWCDALLGLALHVSHDFGEAERTFDRALAAMPDSTRCRWTDASMLLDGEVQKLVRRTPCERRAALNERLWWLADPLYSIEGNELRAEHFARHTFAVLHDRWRASHPFAWGGDIREMTLRYAWPVAWSRDRTTERSPVQPGYSIALTGHEPNPAYDFFPDAQALQSPYDVSDASWELKRPRAMTHYAHPFAAPIRPLRHQIAQFRRGDSLLIVGAWDASDDTLFNRADGRVAIVASTADGRVGHIERFETASPRGVTTLAVPGVDYVASLELFGAGSRAVGRAREGVRASSFASGVAISDILLLEPGEHPRTFDEALDRVLPDGRLADRRVTLYWEVYGGVSVDVPQVMVSVSRVRASRMRRLAEKLRLRDEPESVEMQWETDAPGESVAAGSVTLDLRDQPAGTWRVSITVTAAGGRTASSARDVILQRR